MPTKEPLFRIYIIIYIKYKKNVMKNSYLIYFLLFITNFILSSFDSNEKSKIIDENENLFSDAKMSQYFPDIEERKKVYDCHDVMKSDDIALEIMNEEFENLKAIIDPNEINKKNYIEYFQKLKDCNIAFLQQKKLQQQGGSQDSSNSSQQQMYNNQGEKNPAREEKFNEEEGLPQEYRYIFQEIEEYEKEAELELLQAEEEEKKNSYLYYKYNYPLHLPLLLFLLSNKIVINKKLGIFKEKSKILNFFQKTLSNKLIIATAASLLFTMYKKHHRKERYSSALECLGDVREPSK